MNHLAIHQASIPVFVRSFRALAILLEKGAADAEERGYDPAILVNARLAPDMFSLAGQVQRASDTSKMSVERLTTVAAPSFADTETTFAELQQRIANTIAYLESVSPESFEGSDTRTVSIKIGEFKGDAYLLEFALPNFFFHIAAAHAILRHNGVKVGKLDYLGEYR